MITLWGRRRQGKERKGRKRRENEKERKHFVLALVLAEKNHQEDLSVLRFYKVILWDFSLKSFSFVYWDVKYIVSPSYFMKKVGAFVVWKLLFISDLNTVFIPEIVLMSLGVVDRQIVHMMTFWKSIYI